MSSEPSQRTIRFIAFLTITVILAAYEQVPAQSHRSPTSHRPGGSAEQYIAEGQALLAKKRFRKAIRLFSAAIRADRDAALAYKLRGRVYEHIGRTVKAARDYTRYIELRPGDARGYMLRGDVFNFNFEHAKALEDYNRAIRLAPRIKSVHMSRGLAYTALGKYHMAIQDFRQALKKDPRNPELIGNLGVAYMLARRPIKAVESFHKALAVETDPSWRKRMQMWRDKLLEDPKIKMKFARRPTEPRRVPFSESLW